MPKLKTKNQGANLRKKVKTKKTSVKKSVIADFFTEEALYLFKFSAEN